MSIRDILAYAPVALRFWTYRPRRFVAGAVALSAFAATGSTFASKAQAQPRLHRIDVHHHISPPTWLNAMKKSNLDNPPMASWSVQKTPDDRDKGGVATAITSPTTPPFRDKFTREIVDGELRRFYYDTAQVSNSVAIGALAKLVPISQIVYGTDYPYRTATEHTKGLDAKVGRRGRGSRRATR